MAGLKQKLVLGIGEILWDVMPDGKYLGGAPANFAFHSAQLGADAHIVSAIGDDPLGGEIQAQLAELDVPTDLIAVLPNRPTGTVTVELDDAGLPSYTIHENVAWDAIPMTDAIRAAAERADAVCFGSLAQRSEISRATIREILAATPAECLRVFDINLRQHYFDRATLEEGLQAANVLKLNDEELPVLVGLLENDEPLPANANFNLENVLLGLVAYFDLKMVALTRGARGAILVTPDSWNESPGKKVDVVDTVGAGDAMTAAITMGLLREESPASIVRWASDLAAYVCTQAGATPKHPKG